MTVEWEVRTGGLSPESKTVPEECSLAIPPPDQNHDNSSCRNPKQGSLLSLSLGQAKTAPTQLQKRMEIDGDQIGGMLYLY